MAGKECTTPSVSRQPTSKRPNLEMDPASPESVPMASLRTLLSEFVSPINKRLDNIDQSIITINSKLDSMADLQVRITSLESDTDEMKDRISNLEDENNAHKSATCNMQKAVQSVESQIQQSVHAGRSLSHESDAIKDKLLDLECRSRRDNLLFTDIQESRYENCDNIIVHICQQAGLDINPWALARAHRIGPFRRNHCRPIIAKFQHYKLRDMVWQSRKHIKSTCYVKVTEDYPSEIVERRKRLYPIVDAAFNFKDTENPRLHYSAKIVIDKLIVNGDTYTVVG